MIGWDGFYFQIILPLSSKPFKCTFVGTYDELETVGILAGWAWLGTILNGLF